MSDDLAPMDLILRGLSRAALEAWLAECSVVELAALWHDWRAWARPKQLPPQGNWKSWGFLGARRMGKTWAVSHFVNEEVAAGRARLVGVCAQNEANTINVQIEGENGLIATAPPWNKPTFSSSALKLRWPNGAEADARTPEVPGAIRGPEYDLFWATELQSWPVATRAETWANIELATSVGVARIVWDCTPKRGLGILKERLAEAAERPDLYRVVRGVMEENRANLARGYVDEMRRKHGGTGKGREELDGEMIDDTDGALVQQKWIDGARRSPTRIARQVVAVDPAGTARRGSDQTGIIRAGLDIDGQVLVLADRTGRHKAEEWTAIALSEYTSHGCDLLTIETNMGHDLLVPILRSTATTMGLTIQPVAKDWVPRVVPGVVHVREIHSRGQKADRAQPLVTAYHAGRVSHVIGVDLAALEDTLTSWVPTAGHNSPDRLDALVIAVVELLGLTDEKADPREGFRGYAAAAAKLAGGAATPGALSRLYRAGSGRVV